MLRRIKVPLGRPGPIAQRTTRRIHVTASAPSLDPVQGQQPIHPDPLASSIPSPDARFEVLGSPFSLLSVSLSASQNLYTRRGTLVGLSGKAENTLSTLSVLEPFRRSIVGIPFLYQKVSSTSPITALISAKSPISSIVTVHLDGRQDWLVAQRQALLAWTGHSLTLKPSINTRLSLAHWGNTYATGRGLVALVGNGQIYQVQLKAGESYVAHPSNVVAYTVSENGPFPFRFKSSSLRFQVPDLGFVSMLKSIKFVRIMSETPTWRTLSRFIASVRTWTMRSIWGDRLFLRFQGPSTLLLQTRASRVSDVLTMRDVEEIAASPPGAVQEVVKMVDSKQESSSRPPPVATVTDSAKPKYASIHSDGKMHIDAK